MIRAGVSLIVLILVTFSIQSQNLNDAVRFSTFDVIGTARNLSVGGAMGAFGTDFGSITQNPAGMGNYRWSEFNFTPYFPVIGTRSTLLGDGNEESDVFSEFKFSNVGLVMVGRPQQSSLKTINFGIGLNQTASFDENFFFEGTSPGSITYRFIDQANGLAPEQLDQFEGFPAFVTGAIYDFDEDLIYENDFMSVGENFPVTKRQEGESTGGINELVIALAGNINEKILIGGALGVPFFQFEQTKTYSESDDLDQIPFFDNLEFTEFLSTTGTGLYFKAGAIINFSKALRWGVSYHSPTRFRFNDVFATNFVYQYTDDTGQNFQEEPSPNGSFDYRFRTPMRLSTQLGYLIKKSGFLGAEFEYADFTNTFFTMDADRAYERDLNAQIVSDFRGVFTARLGGEYARKRLRARAGIQLATAPFVNDNNLNLAYSAGIGVRGRVFLDLGYRLNTQAFTYSPYTLPSSLGYQVNVDQRVFRHQILATVGMKI